MKYIIKCPYCDKTYTVNISGKATDFICSSCGGANGMQDVVKQVATPQILSGRGKKDHVTETNIDTIKSFNMEEHKVEKPFYIGWLLVIIMIAVVLAALCGLVTEGGGALIIVINFIIIVPIICYQSANAESAANEQQKKTRDETESLEDELDPWYPEMFDEKRNE